LAVIAMVGNGPKAITELVVGQDITQDHASK